MVLVVSTNPSNPEETRSYVRSPVRLHFPVEQRMPESVLHFRRRTLLFESLARELAGRALVASDQFVYWDPTDPAKSLAPDLALRRGEPGEPLTSWKTWERGAPEVGVEIASDSDAPEREIESKLERYRRAGIAEVVRFDPENAREPLRCWDFIDGDLVEREPSDPDARRCDALGLYWCVRDDPELGRTLRLAHDVEGKLLVPTPEEAERAAKEAALSRVAELEAELARRDRSNG